MPGEVLEGPRAARADAMADAVLYLGHLTARRCRPTLCRLALLSFLPGFILPLGNPLRQPIALAA
jgi:hypothetical protein